MIGLQNKSILVGFCAGLNIPIFLCKPRPPPSPCLFFLDEEMNGKTCLLFFPSLGSASYINSHVVVLLVVKLFLYLIIMITTHYHIHDCLSFLLPCLNINAPEKKTLFVKEQHRSLRIRLAYQRVKR